MAKRPLEFTIIKLSPHGRWGGVEQIVEGVKLAEELGYDAINMPDHLVLPQTSATPLPDVWYDNFVIAAHLAAVTKRIRFLFFILVIPYRHPIHTAKLLATLDAVSKGRITVGAGIGWLRGEFEALGVPFTKRGALTEEYLRAMRALWTEERPTFQGKTIKFTDVSFNPKCYQQPHIPIWIGGSAPLAIPRMVELGEDWLPWMPGSDEEMRGHIVTIKEQLAAAERDADQFGFATAVSIGPRDAYTPHPSAAQDIGHRRGAGAAAGPLPYEQQAIIEAIARKQEDGFNHFTISFGWESPLELMRHMEWFAARVLPSFRGAAVHS